MAVVNAANTGNWSSSATWPGGVFPTSADDVHANGKTVTIDQDITVLSLRTTIGAGGVTGGTFSVVSSRTINAPNIYVGSTSCVTCNLPPGASVVINGNCLGTLHTASGEISALFINSGAGTITVTGNVEGGSSTTLVTYGILNQGGATCVLNVIGTVRGGAQGNSFGILHSSQGTTNVTGDVYANNTGGNRGRGLRSSGIGVVNITGNVYGQTSDGVDFYNNGGVINVFGNVTGGFGYAGLSTGFLNTVNVIGNVYPGSTGSNSHGISWSGGGTCTITGNVYGNPSTGGNGVRLSSSGTVIINGSVFAGDNQTSVVNSSSGTIEITRVVGNGYGIGSTGLGQVFAVQTTSQASVVKVKEVEFGSRGQSPIFGNVYLTPVSSNVAQTTLTTGSTKNLVDASVVSGLLPSASNVRLGISYNSGNLTGTCAVPSPSSVVSGVAVDNTIGTATLIPSNVWDYPISSVTSNSVGEKLKKTAIPADIIALG